MLIIYSRENYFDGKNNIQDMIELACWQALHLWQAKRAVREHTNEGKVFSVFSHSLHLYLLSYASLM